MDAARAESGTIEKYGRAVIVVMPIGEYVRVELIELERYANAASSADEE